MDPGLRRGDDLTVLNDSDVVLRYDLFSKS